MTTLPDRPNTALIVIDAQKGVVDGAYQRDAVVSNINTLVDKAARRRRDHRLGAAFFRGDGPGKRNVGVRERAVLVGV